jgi:hypothetical protein
MKRSDAHGFLGDNGARERQAMPTLGLATKAGKGLDRAIDPRLANQVANLLFPEPVADTNDHAESFSSYCESLSLILAQVASGSQLRCATLPPKLATARCCR